MHYLRKITGVTPVDAFEFLTWLIVINCSEYFREGKQCFEKIHGEIFTIVNYNCLFVRIVHITKQCKHKEQIFLPVQKRII